MHISLPKYTTTSDRAIMLFIVVPWILVLNRLIVGPLYFQRPGIFLSATVITFLVLGLSWQLHTWIAVVFKNRFPHEQQTAVRLLLEIPLFMLITALFITFFFWGYTASGFPGAVFTPANYQAALITGAFVNVFSTILHEAVARFEKWKAVLVENEQLKKEYMQSQLLGLKSQINPHFLFNSLNSLSSLINEDEKEAELFLDEMCKVYRYLLRNNDEELVTLHTELEFIRSFFFLLKTRYGRAMELHIAVSEGDTEKSLPPLTLQMLLEDVIYCNTCSREQPIVIDITASGDELLIRNTVHPKLTEETGPSGNLENVMNKFWLLCQKRVAVDEGEGSRVIRIPLITEKRGKAA